MLKLLSVKLKSLPCFVKDKTSIVRVLKVIYIWSYHDIITRPENLSEKNINTSVQHFTQLFVVLSNFLLNFPRNDRVEYILCGFYLEKCLYHSGSLGSENWEQVKFWPGTICQHVSQITICQRHFLTSQSQAANHSRQDQNQTILRQNIQHQAKAVWVSQRREITERDLRCLCLLFLWQSDSLKGNFLEKWKWNTRVN